MAFWHPHGVGPHPEEVPRSSSAFDISRRRVHDPSDTIPYRTAVRAEAAVVAKRDGKWQAIKVVDLLPTDQVSQVSDTSIPSHETMRAFSRARASKTAA